VGESGERILITGICGFTGRHLAAYLRADRSATLVGLDRLPQAGVPVDLYVCCDLGDRGAVEEVVSRTRPTTVFHLAALMGGAAPDEILRVNVGGFVLLRDVLRQQAAALDWPVRLVTVGSAAEIGSKGVVRLPVSEEVPCEPETPYGQSKWEITRLAMAEPSGSLLEIIVARPFNLVGPGLSPQLSLGNFARQVAAATRGELRAIRCGPLDTRRDFVDVRDAVRAYVALAERGRPREIYNVCAGRSYRLGWLLDTLISLASVRVRIHSDASPRGPEDLADIYGDRTKIAREVGWEPSIGIERSLADLLAAT
jgi:nucleoside-diphosphate-sugar epimerase